MICYKCTGKVGNLNRIMEWNETLTQFVCLPRVVGDLVVRQIQVGHGVQRLSQLLRQSLQAVVADVQLR
jgi:hypothetical protein